MTHHLRHTQAFLPLYCPSSEKCEFSRAVLEGRPERTPPSYHLDLRLAASAAGNRSLVKHQRSSAGRGGRAMSGKEAVRTYKRCAKCWRARAQRRAHGPQILLAMWREGVLS